MNISEKLTQQKFLEILLTFYIKGQEEENITLTGLLDEMKQKVILVLNKRD